MTPATATRRQVPLEALLRHADRHDDPWADPALSSDVDPAARYTSDDLCPLAHLPIWNTLTDAHRLRYNQLVGLLHNELIVMFETGIAAHALPVLMRDDSLPAELREALARFLDDERAHTAAFRALSHATAPDWYDGNDFHVLRLPRPMTRAFETLARRPGRFPFLFWLMLIMEERSLMISRAVARQDGIDPRWAAVYRAHLIDEVRHVQTDWHLIDRLWRGRSALTRRANALLLRGTIVGLFLKPRRANVRLIDLLVADFPELSPRRPELLAAVRSLTDAAGYRRMMYSAQATPITRKLCHELPELRGLWGRMSGEG